MNKTFEQININIKQIRELEYTCQLMPLQKGFGHTLGNVIKHMLLNYTYGICATGIRIKEDNKFVENTSQINECIDQVISNIKTINPLEYGIGTINCTDNNQFTTNHIQECKVRQDSKFLFSTKRDKKITVQILFEQGFGVSIPNNDFIYIQNTFSPILFCNIQVSDLMIKGITSHNILDIYLKSKYPINCNQIIQQACKNMSEKIYNIANN